jgi:hypothetical protein
MSWSTTVIHGTSVLLPGQSWSTNRITMVLQSDGNLVIRDLHGRTLWSAGTAGRGAKVVFQGDGNFVVYTSSMQTAWSSRTDGHNGAKLVLQDDGNVTILYGSKALWSSGTAQ